MELLRIIIKIGIILAMVLLMALPFILEFCTFRGDKDKKISYKRFRVVLYTGIYILAVTLALYLLKRIILGIESLSFVEWIVKKVGLSNRSVYFGKVLSAILLNFAIGVVFVFFSKFVRIGMKKKSLTEPAKADGKFSLSQRIERAVVKFFYNETWFFVGCILKWLCVVLSTVYALVFIAYQLPAMFGASFLPYRFLSMLFDAGYVYPTISLLGLWEAYFFLEGIKRLEDECPELLKEETLIFKKMEVDLAAIDEEVRRQFRDYHALDVDISQIVPNEDVSSTDHSYVTKMIANAVENDTRNPQIKREAYLNCLDKLVEEEKSVIINGSFFSEFSTYFIRYLSMILARGDNIVFVCNSESQIEAVHDYLVQGLSEIQSLYCKGFESDAIDFDHPIWRVCKVKGEEDDIEEAFVDDSNILVTSLSYLCSTRFENQHGKFISLIDDIVFVDSLKTVNTYNRQLAILNTRLKHVTKENSLKAKNSNEKELFRTRYISRNIRYICFNDTRAPGLDRVMTNMTCTEFVSVDAMQYNPKTIVRCYNFEGKANDKGRYDRPQVLNTEEEIGILMKMAICLAKGTGNVSIFADDIIPYANFAESISANMGQISVKADGECIRINRQYYNPDDYSVIIAVDSGDNLPATLRRYLSMVSDSPAMIIIFSRPYMLRDYYLGNLDGIWCQKQIEWIPVEEGTKKDIAQQILVKANAGGITKKEVMRLASGDPCFDKYVKKDDVNGVLRAVLEVYGETHTESMHLFRYFEYKSTQDFDEHGKYDSEIKIVLRRQGKLFDALNGRNMVVMVVGENEIPLPVPRGRLTQNFIADQNLVHNGKIYYIQKIDTENGRIYARLAVGGKNDEAYQYVQDREYRLDPDPDKIEYVATKHLKLKLAQDDVKVSDVFVSSMRVPMDVVTKGYYEVDPHTLSRNCETNIYHSIWDEGNDTYAKQAYRRYGNVKTPYYTYDSARGGVALNVKESGAMALTLRIVGKFGPDRDKTVALAATMLHELLGSMFPSVADSIAVCPVLRNKQADSKDMESILRRHPRITFMSQGDLGSEDDFEIVIIEDSDTDLGVISVLMSSGNNILRMLFTPLFEYLKWHTESVSKSNYLCYGLDHEPDCFDFNALYKLSRLLGDDGYDDTFVNLQDLMEYTVCDFCGKKYHAGDDAVELDDGRIMCKACAEKLVGNNKKVLKAHLDRAKVYLESTYGITLDEDYEFCFESTVKIVNTLKQNRELFGRGSDAPLKSYVDDKKKVHVEYSIPSVNLSELLVRELTHVWQLKHLPEIPEELAEGHIALVAIQYLRFLNQKPLAAARTNYYESTALISGVGYRRLVRELIANPGYRNNPFLYLLKFGGDSVEESEKPIPTPKPRIIEAGEYGLPYTPQTSDRLENGKVKYFYYERLTASWQRVYDDMVEAVRAHAPQMTVPTCSWNEIEKIFYMVVYDHPELFWFRWIRPEGNVLHLLYGADAEECELLQRQIDEAASKYLEGIDDSMSAYDVTLRLHAKMIGAVDYDTIALRAEDARGGTPMNEIDYLRSVCGVFLNGKAVCEGYARAMQYLLQKCGVECAEAAGHIRKENGAKDGAHAWNIVKLDGDYYYLDTTWDDSSNTVQDVKSTDIGFKYFAITTEELCRSRDVDLCYIQMPACTATRCNYYYHNDCVIDHYDLEKIKTIAQTAAKNKCSQFSFKCATEGVLNEVLQQMFTLGSDGFEVVKAAAKIDKRISNSYTYGYDRNIYIISIYFKYE